MLFYAVPSYGGSIGLGLAFICRAVRICSEVMETWEELRDLQHLLALS